MNFSIILPTRERVALFTEFLESIRETAKYPHLVEVLVVVQEDDPVTIRAIADIQTEFANINFKYWILPWTERYCSTYKNYLGRLARGKFIISGDDEHFYHTVNWDEIALDTFEEFLKDKPDRVLYGRPQDNNGKDQKKYSCVPILSKEVVEITDCFYDPRYYGWGADQNLFALFNGLNRTCYVDIFIEHRSHHHKARLIDSTNQRVADISSRHPQGAMDDDITDKRRQKLLGVINNDR